MRMNLVGLALLSAGVSIAGCRPTPQATPPPTPAPALARPDIHAAYVKDHAVGNEWFAHASDAYGGVPLVLLRSLPDLAPEIWGKPEEQFSRFGYLPNPGGPLPLGLSWDSMDPNVTAQPLHPVALTCGACHIGRVQLDDGTLDDARRWSEYPVRRPDVAQGVRTNRARTSGNPGRRRRRGRAPEHDDRAKSPPTISTATPAV